MNPQLESIINSIGHHLDSIYGSRLSEQEKSLLTEELVLSMRLDKHIEIPAAYENLWDEKDIVLITYGDSIRREGVKPLKTLSQFLTHYVKDFVSGVHVLPFYPHSSDDGFAVIDYYEVESSLGGWDDIICIAKDFDLMADLVINHCSSQSQWFKNFIAGKGPGFDYFESIEPGVSTHQVVRPRTSPLLKSVETSEGKKFVWCTFSHDQIDLNFKNPKVLVEFVKIIRTYLDNGVNIFRLDAIAFLWKKTGTNCLNLPETHEIVRLLRLLIAHAKKEAIIITETNIPNRENLSYFGNANEAHMIYNFSLPPLLLNTMVTGDCRHLKQWLMSMPPAQNGTAFFNFIASHDGIGLRPAEGLLDEEEIASLINTMQSFGGEISWRADEDGQKSAYEINISLFDALQGTTKGADDFGVERFLCAHAIMLSLEGLPAIYIHSLFGTHNDNAGFEKTKQKRSINRHRWNEEELLAHLDDKNSVHHSVFFKMKELIQLRQEQKAFHPNATQFTLHLGEQLFGFWRQSVDRRQSIFCIFNVSDTEQNLLLSDLNLIVTNDWRDLISGLVCNDEEKLLSIAPYQVLWITNC